jgi:fatty-acyl-CoA synthase
VPEVTQVSDASTVAALLRARADDDHEALRFEGTSWTWREVVEQSNRRAHVLLDLLPPGAPPHVGVMLENVPEYLFLMGGAALAGAVLVGINPTRRGAERATDVRHTDCQLICTDQRRAELVAEDTGVDATRVFDVDDEAWTALVSAAPSTRIDVDVDPSTLFLLIFTSGSTGAPKAVKCTQGRIARSGSLGFQPGDVLYCSMPLFHGNALWSNWVPAIGSGATVVLKRRFSASTFLDDIRAHHVTFVNTVGRALAYVLATPPTEHDRDHDLKIVLAPESAAPDVRAFRERFGCYVIEGYGSSEGAISLAPAKGSPKGALGRPVADMDIAVIDPDTMRECPPARFDPDGTLLNADEAIGELVRRDAGAAFEGYYRNEEADAERTRNGWFWSGDLLYRDEAGELYFAGRKGDWVRVDGENFATAPVERILGRHAPFAGVAVYAVPDPRTGDQVMAAVELRPGAAFDVDAFQHFLDEQPDLGTKWAPRFVRVVDALPVTATNKLDKKPLKQARWEAPEVWWRPGRDAGWEPVTEAVRAQLRTEFAEHGRAHLLELA